MSYLLGIIRLVLFTIIVALYIFIFPILLLFIRKSQKEIFGLRYRGLIARTLVPTLGIKIIKSGNTPRGPGLLVSNHRSYVDPAPVAIFTPILPIAKMEIGHWPLLGIGVKLTGILLVDRSDQSSRTGILRQMKKAWSNNHLILNYPEGTTHDQVQTKKFLKGAFAIAAAQNVPVTPICIEYGQALDAWIGNDTFLPHFIRCFGKWRTTIFLEFGQPILDQSYTQTMDQTKNWIDLRLAHYQQILLLKK